MGNYLNSIYILSVYNDHSIAAGAWVTKLCTSPKVGSRTLSDNSVGHSDHLATVIPETVAFQMQLKGHLFIKLEENLWAENTDLLWLQF